MQASKAICTSYTSYYSHYYLPYFVVVPGKHYDKNISRIQMYLLFIQVFKTQADGDGPAQLANYVNNVVPSNSVVIVTVWNSGHRCTGDCHTALVNIGSNRISSIKYAGNRIHRECFFVSFCDEQCF